MSLLTFDPFHGGSAAWVHSAPRQDVARVPDNPWYHSRFEVDWTPDLLLEV